ncbi:Eco47II family restriction endonuclease [Enterococcus hirae]
MYNLNFISEEDLTNHVQKTIKKYGDNLNSYNLKKFNKNIVDPIKLIFDKNIYNTTWEGIIESEIFRQRDKSNNNAIGYFHQNIFSYFDNCIVPKEGWDVIFKNKKGINISGNIVDTVYVEMKNKHNTMNSASSAKTFIKMQNQILEDDNCATLLVEAIAKKTQNIKWETTIDKKRVGHKLIRRVSIDKFYEIVTGEATAFYDLCLILPTIITNVLENSQEIKVPEDSVLKELNLLSKEKDISIVLAIYFLGFSTYNGFNDKNAE